MQVKTPYMDGSGGYLRYGNSMIVDPPETSQEDEESEEEPNNSDEDL